MYLHAVFLWFSEKSNKRSRINTAQKMKFSIKDFFSKCDQIRRKLRIWSHLLKNSIIQNFIFRAVFPPHQFIPLDRLVTGCHSNSNLKFQAIPGYFSGKQNFSRLLMENSRLQSKLMRTETRRQNWTNYLSVNRQPDKTT